MRAWGALCAALAISLTLCAQPDAAQRQLALDSFERVWTTIRDTHWEKNPAGLDWQAIHDEFRPKVAKAANMDEARVAIREMLARLHQTHFALFPATVYDAVREDAAGPGAPGIDLRILDKQAVVTGVDPGSGAERAGVRPGWAIQNVRGMDLSPAIRALTSDPSISDLSLTRAVLARLSGPVGAKVSVAFLDGSNRRVSLDLELAEPRGAPRIRQSSRAARLVRDEENREDGLHPVQPVPGRHPSHGWFFESHRGLPRLRWPCDRFAGQSRRPWRDGDGHRRIFG